MKEAGSSRAVPSWLGGRRKKGLTTYNALRYKLSVRKETEEWTQPCACKKESGASVYWQSEGGNEK